MKLVIGASGQDGLILSRALALRGERVVAIGSNRSRERGVESILPEIEWLFSSPTGELPLGRIKGKPDQIFHFAGDSSVWNSWAKPFASMPKNLELSVGAMDFAIESEAHLVLAGSSEMYSRRQLVVSESTPLFPSSPYGVSKAAAFEMSRLLREKGVLKSSNLVMFNHESPLRNSEFLTKKLVRQLIDLSAGKRNELTLRNKAATKDFSWAPDFVRVMTGVNLLDLNEDFVLASSESSSVEQLALAGLDIMGLEAEILQTESSAELPQINPTGDPSKAEMRLGFKKTNGGKQLMQKLIDLELRAIGLSEMDSTKLFVSALAEEALT